jgi:hypothetical protein
MAAWNSKDATGLEARERAVEEIVARFRRALKRGAPSPWKVVDELYDDRGLPR